MNIRKPEYEIEAGVWLVVLVFNIVVVSVLGSSYAGVNYQNGVYDFKPCTIYSVETVVAGEFVSVGVPRLPLGNFTRDSTCYRVKGDFLAPVIEGEPKLPLAGLIPVAIIGCGVWAFLTWRLFISS